MRLDTLRAFRFLTSVDKLKIRIQDACISVRYGKGKCNPRIIHEGPEVE